MHLKTWLILPVGSSYYQPLFKIAKSSETEFKLKRTTREIEGVSFRQGNVCFKGFKVDRKFSHENLKKEFEKNKEVQQEQKEQQQEQAVDKPKTGNHKAIGGITLTPEQLNTLEEGGYNLKT